MSGGGVGGDGFSLCRKCIDAVSTTADYCASSGCIFFSFLLYCFSVQFFRHVAERGCRFQKRV